MAAEQRGKSFWARIPAVWKALAVVGAIFSAGAVGHSYLSRYATLEDLKDRSAAGRALATEVSHLGQELARQGAEVKAARDDAAEARKTMSELLMRMLDPTTRRGGSP